MEILDSGRLVGVEPVPAASDQESGELVLAPGEYVDVEVCSPPPNLTRYVAPAFNQIRSDGHQLLLSFFANAEYYLRAQGHKATGETWHKRLGHPSQSTLNNTIKAAVLDKNSLLLPSGLELKPVNRPAPCTICPTANLPHELFPTHFPGAEDYHLMDKVYSDILNLHADGFNGERYVITFTEASTRYVWTGNMTNHFLAFTTFRTWLPLAERDSDTKLKAFQCDGAGEYRSNEFTTYLQERGIRRIFSLPHAHQQSGVAERLNRTLQEKMRALLAQTQLGPLYWPFAMDHATVLHNLLSSSALPNNASPYLLWTGKLGTTKLLRVLGCVVQYRPPTAPLGKFDQRAKWGLHLGIEKQYLAWCIMDYRSRLFVPARDCIFYENLTLPVFEQHLAMQRNPATLFQGRTDDNPHYQTGLQILGLAAAVQHSSTVNLEPKTARQSLSGPHRKKWREAMDRELAALEKRETWDLIPNEKTVNKNVLTGKWVFRVKTKADGTYEKHKARWVVRGFDQTHGIDYTLTFAPISRHTSVRLVLCEAARKNFPLRQIDVSNAFLYADVDAEIYVEYPHTYPTNPPSVCKLKKSQYGIKQAPRLWQQHLNRKLTEVGFRQLPHDPGMYRLDDKGSYALLVAYVDDILYVSSSTLLVDRIEADLKKSLDLTISTKVTQFLGLNISRTSSAIHLTASKYAESLAKRFNISTDFVATPYRSTLTGHVPNLENLSAAGLQLYQQQLGCLLFAAVTCRPDLAYVASHLAQFLRCPKEEHSLDLQRALRYFVSTPTIGLIFNAGKPKDKMYLSGYVDADHAGDTSDRRSRTGDIFRLEPIGPISWNSSKQELVSLSSTEAEFIAACAATRGGLFQFSTTPLVVDHRLTDPFPDEPFESSGPYAELVGCLMYLMTYTRMDLAFPLSVLSCFVATGRHHPVYKTATVRVSTSDMELVLGETHPVVLTSHCDFPYADDVETQRSTEGVEAEIYVGAMASQQLGWLNLLLTDLALPCPKPRAIALPSAPTRLLLALPVRCLHAARTLPALPACRSHAARTAGTLLACRLRCPVLPVLPGRCWPAVSCPAHCIARTALRCLRAPYLSRPRIALRRPALPYLCYQAASSCPCCIANTASSRPCPALLEHQLLLPAPPASAPVAAAAAACELPSRAAQPSRPIEPPG
ncbi:unnamed protein product [Closterium sp. NIES-53]